MKTLNVAVIGCGSWGRNHARIYKYLKNDRPIFVDYKKFNYLKILDIIQKSNGIAVLAHPGMLKHSIFQSVLYKSIKNGLQGIEVYYPRHTIKQSNYLKEIAKEYNLIITGGSDFHGVIKPDIDIHECRKICRMDKTNDYLESLKNPPPHVNFI